MQLCDNDDHIHVLSDDLVVTDNYIENFYSLAKQHPNTLIGSVVTDINNRDKIFSGGIKINWLTGKIRGINERKSLSSFGKGYYADGVSYLNRTQSASSKQGIQGDRNL
jgi:hypothetical protein